jgi:hypothetical protein
MNRDNELDVRDITSCCHFFVATLIRKKIQSARGQALAFEPLPQASNQQENIAFNQQ